MPEADRGRRPRNIRQALRLSKEGEVLDSVPQCVVELAKLIDPEELDALTGKQAATPRLRADD